MVITEPPPVVLIEGLLVVDPPVNSATVYSEADSLKKNGTWFPTTNSVVLKVVSKSYAHFKKTVAVLAPTMVGFSFFKNFVFDGSPKVKPGLKYENR